MTDRDGPLCRTKARLAILRETDDGFRIAEEDEFVRFMSTDIPLPPPRAAELRAVNAGLA